MGVEQIGACNAERLTPLTAHGLSTFCEKMNIDNPWMVLSALAGFLVYLVVIFWILQPWLLCFLAKSLIPAYTILAMRMRKVNVDEVVAAFIVCRKAGIDTSIWEIESLYLNSSDDFRPKVQRLIADRSEK